MQGTSSEPSGPAAFAGVSEAARDGGNTGSPNPGSAARNAPPIIELRQIVKRFGAVTALKGVSFGCKAGEVHAVVGENGAGKSTLIKILAGVLRADKGTSLFDGEPVQFSHPSEAQEKGISIVHQEFNLLPDRTVAQNIFLGREPTRGGLLDRGALSRQAQALLDRLHMHDFIRPGDLVRDLSVAHQQMVEIAKAISFDAKVLVLDEPTAALPAEDVDLVIDLVRRLRASGLGIVYISHRLGEVFLLADRITVLKDGASVGTFAAGDVTPGQIVRSMVGRDIEHYYPPLGNPGRVGAPKLIVRGGGNASLRDIDLSVCAGEIVGVFGLQGSGRSELAYALFGAAPFTRGTVEIAGRPRPLSGPRSAAAAGSGLVPENRKDEGLALRQSVVDNALLVSRALKSAWRPAGRRRRRGEVDVRPILHRTDLRAASLDQPVGTLSGGNQQKIVLSKWLVTGADVLILAEPTRGIDVNAKAGIYGLIRELADEGRAIVVLSSELPEIIGMSDRILVMRGGRIVSELPGGADEAEVMLAASVAEHA